MRLHTDLYQSAADYARLLHHEFVRHGATQDILYLSKPHIGTNILKKVVKNIRNTIESLGGEYKFNSKVDEFVINNGRVVGVKACGVTYDCDNVILACGHSARDTIRTLQNVCANVRLG